MFNRRRFPLAIILLCVRWYLKYGIAHRDLAEMLEECGVAVDASIISLGAALRAGAGEASALIPELSLRFLARG